jgi:hypothetical protein
MRLSRCVVVVVSALTLAGCWSDAEDAPSYPEGESDQVQIQAVVDSFNRAASDLDADVLCAEVIAPSRRGGTVDRCAERVDPAMDAAPENWSQISELREIRVRGQAATADGLQGGDRIPLVFQNEDDRWWMQVVD